MVAHDPRGLAAASDPPARIVAHGVRCHRHTEQMRVGRQVDGQVVLEIQTEAVEFSKEALAKGSGHARAEKVPDPQPRE